MLKVNELNCTCGTGITNKTVASHLVAFVPTIFFWFWVVTVYMLLPEEVRRGDVTAGVKHVRNIITADKYSFSILEAFYFQFSLRPAQALVLWMLSKCKVQPQIQK